MGFVLKATGGPAGPPPTREEPQVAVAPDCRHESVEVRRRARTDGVVCAVRQCLRCGKYMGDVPKKSVDIETIPAWDEALKLRGEEERQEAWRNAARAREAARERHDAEWQAWYKTYLASPQWSEKREAVLRRDRRVCQGCGKPGASQAHHMTYVRVGREMLFDLVAICVACHEAVHRE